MMWISDIEALQGLSPDDRIIVQVYDRNARRSFWRKPKPKLTVAISRPSRWSFAQDMNGAKSFTIEEEPYGHLF